MKAQDLAKARRPPRTCRRGFATLAALDLAKAEAMVGKRDEAIASLRAAKSRTRNWRSVVRERLARLLLDAGKADEALRILADADDPAGLGARDAHLPWPARPGAGDYDKALALTTVGSPMRRVLELKLSEVGGAPAQAKVRFLMAPEVPRARRFAHPVAVRGRGGVRAAGRLFHGQGLVRRQDKSGEVSTKPAELVEFAPSANVTKLWSAKAGGGEGRLGARQVWRWPTVASMPPRSRAGSRVRPADRRHGLDV